MSKDFFLEIGCEEIPSRFLKETAEAIATNLKNFFKEEEIEHDEVEVYFTPRRLIFCVKDVSEEQKEKVIKIKGPSKKISFTQNGEPSPALKGFLSKHNATIEDISIEKTTQGEYVFLNKKLEKKETKYLLEENLPKIILSIPMKKSMRWDGVTFVRPIRWIVSIFGDTVVNFKIGTVKSSNRTKPFLKAEKRDIVVKNFNDYKDAMKKEAIVISSDERIEIINSSLLEMEKEFLVEIDKDKNLIYELANLTESPKVFHLVLSKEAKKIPQSIVSGIIKMGARMFPGFRDGEILYVFGVQNGINRDTEVIKNGFNRVVSAKINDAVFFYNKDREIPLKDRIDFLKSITFETHLGSYYDKTMRILKLTSFIGEMFNLTEKERLVLDRAALLSKADLGTLTVAEYPELHGFVGKELALESGEKEDVAQTILDHIFPRFKGDRLPHTNTGKVLGIIDRVDTLVGSFAVGLEPTGSEDPYGLRRVAIGLLSILISFKNTVNIGELIDVALRNFDKDLVKDFKKENLIKFLKQRFKIILEELNVRYDVINAVLKRDDFSPYLSFKKARFIEENYNSKEFNNFVLAYKRIYNIVRDFKPNKELKEEIFLTEYEKKLFSKCCELERKIQKLDLMDFEKVMNEFYSIVPEINEFFDNVLVMDKNENIRENRLSLLSNLLNIFKEFASFEEIVKKTIIEGEVKNGEKNL